MTTYSPAQKFTDLAALLDAAVGLMRLEFDEHPRNASLTRRLNRLRECAADARTAALRAAMVGCSCQRLERRINRVRDRFDALAIDLDLDGLSGGAPVRSRSAGRDQAAGEPEGKLHVSV